MTIGKAPAFQFYPNDWCHDLDEHPLEIEGAWIRICCKLWWSKDKGKLSRDLGQWSKILRIKENDCERILNYIEKWKIGDISNNGNGEITIVSRRMISDDKDRLNNAKRQERFREKHKYNGSVTPPSHRSSSSSSSSNTKTYMQLFDKFWEIYPSRNGRKVTKKESLQCFKEQFKSESKIALLLQATENYSKSCKEGFAKDPIRFLKKDFWRDWLEKPEEPDDPYANFERIGGKDGSQNRTDSNLEDN